MGLFARIIAKITSKKTEGWVEDLYENNPELKENAEKTRESVEELNKSLKRDSSIIDEL